MRNEIKKILAREIFNSRGRPTVEVELQTNLGKFQASVASGISKGQYEAKELEAVKAVENIKKIIGPSLEGKELVQQQEIDEFLIQLDATKNKSRLGANAILPVSLAACRAGAAARNSPLWRYISKLTEAEPLSMMPRPSFNMIEGGKHAENSLPFQEFMVVPQKASFRENLETGQKIYQKIKALLKDKFKEIKLSVEGAFFAPTNIEGALDLILEAGLGEDIRIAIDVAASSKPDGKIYQELIEKYPIMSLEDPFEQDDFEGFAKLKNEMGDRILIFGDDLTVSNVERIKMAKRKGAINGLVLKPNQIGTVTETLEAAKLAKSYGWKIMVANRAGETEDDFIADLAVGIGANFIKSGAPFPKERMTKYNRLVEIEKELQK